MNTKDTATHAQILKVVQEILNDKYGCDKDIGTALRICKGLGIDYSGLDWTQA